MRQNRTLPELRNLPYGRAVLGNEPVVFHCNYYNYWLQQVLLLNLEVRMEDVIRDAASAVAYSLLSAEKRNSCLSDPLDVLTIARDVFAEQGFGLLDFSALSERGGEVVADVSHYGQFLFSAAGLDRFETPQNIFDQGFAAGAAEVAFDKPQGSFLARPLACHSTGDAKGRIELQLRTPPAGFLPSPGQGKSNKADPGSPNADTNVDEDVIKNSLAALDFSGNEEGLIPRFDVMLTRHFSSFYNRISFEFLRRMTGTGLSEAAEILLVDAGYRCAFHTFGGVMKSAEWDAVVRPQCKTKEDWVHGMVAVVNTLGWGIWRVHEVTEKRIVMRIYDDYESRGYLGMYGTSERAICHLAQAGVAGLMNLIYIGEIEKKPLLDRAFFETVFEDSNRFDASQTQCMACGDEFTEIIAER